MKKLFIFILSSLFFISGGGVATYAQKNNNLTLEEYEQLLTERKEKKQLSCGNYDVDLLKDKMFSNFINDDNIIKLEKNKNNCPSIYLPNIDNKPFEYKYYNNDNSTKSFIFSFETLSKLEIYSMYANYFINTIDILDEYRVCHDYKKLQRLIDIKKEMKSCDFLNEYDKFNKDVSIIKNHQEYINYVVLFIDDNDVVYFLKFMQYLYYFNMLSYEYFSEYNNKLSNK